MTDPITPERLAELRENYDHGTDDALECLLELLAIGSHRWQTEPKARDNWIRSLKAYQADHIAMLAEIDRTHADHNVTAPFTGDEADRHKRLTTEMLNEVLAKLQQMDEGLAYDAHDGIEKIRNDSARSAYRYAAEIVRTVGGIPA